MSKQIIERRIQPSKQFTEVCGKEFDKIESINIKDHKKIKKEIKLIKQTLFNGHSTAIKSLGRQSKWIIGMIGGTFFVLLAGVLAIILKG